jgi:hypothetical protein
MMNTLRLGAAVLAFALGQATVVVPAFAEIREVVIVGTFRTPAGKLEDIVYETNAQYTGCRVSLPGLKLNMQRQIQGYVETQGWLLESARCAFRTKAGEIEEFDTR